LPRMPGKKQSATKSNSQPGAKRKDFFLTIKKRKKGQTKSML